MKNNKKRLHAEMGKRKLKFTNLFIPLVHCVHYKGRLTKILILIFEGIDPQKKFPMSDRDYESVDEKILS